MASFSGGTACCAIDEITGLEHDKTPEKALKGLFARYLRYGQYPEKNIDAFYIFSGVVKYEDPKEDWDKTGIKYAQNLAELIKREKLGRIATLPAEWNRVNHPDHKVKVYLWRPDPIRLIAWMKNYKEN